MSDALLDDAALEASWVVANNAMNRERGFCGGNSYTKDLRFDLLAFLEARLRTQERVVWADLCCGSGKALREAATTFAGRGLQGRVTLLGVDLVDHFVSGLSQIPSITLYAEPLRTWEPPVPCDLLTCVHGLHYVGDKLGLIERAASWLTSDGIFLAHLDRANVRSPRGGSLARSLGKAFTAAGIDFHPRHRILRIDGQQTLRLPFVYLGARDDAGPNFTGQPAVHSYYAPTE